MGVPFIGYGGSASNRTSGYSFSSESIVSVLIMLSLFGKLHGSMFSRTKSCWQRIISLFNKDEI